MVRTGIRASAIIIKGSRILLIHRKKVGEEYWVFPGGGVEDGETAEEACIREVKEETSLKVTGIRLAFEDQTFVGGNKHPFYFCDVSDGEAFLSGEEKNMNSRENWYRLEWVELDKVKDIRLEPETAKNKVIELQDLT